MTVLTPTEIINWLHLMLVRDLGLFVEVYLDVRSSKIYAKPKYVFKDILNDDKVAPEEFGYVVSVNVNNMTFVTLKQVIGVLIQNYVVGQREIILVNEVPVNEQAAAPQPEMARPEIQQAETIVEADSEGGGGEAADGSEVDDKATRTDTAAKDGEDRE